MVIRIWRVCFELMEVNSGLYFNFSLANDCCGHCLKKIKSYFKETLQQHSKIYSFLLLRRNIGYPFSTYFRVLSQGSQFLLTSGIGIAQVASFKSCLFMLHNLLVKSIPSILSLHHSFRTMSISGFCPRLLPRSLQGLLPQDPLFNNHDKHRQVIFMQVSQAYGGILNSQGTSRLQSISSLFCLCFVRVG